MPHKNKAEGAAYRAGWRDANKAAKAAYDAKYYAENKAEIAAYHAEYYAAHKAAIAATGAAWHEANKVRVAATGAAWHTANPDKVQANKSRRRALKMSAESDNSVLSDIIALFGSRCLRCGSEVGLSVDHVIPLFLGGSNKLDNKQLLCVSCNSSKGIKTFDYRNTSESVS